MRLMQRGDEISIYRDDDYRTHGIFVRETELYVVVKGTVGDDIGREILVSRPRIVQIVVVKKAPR